MVVSMTRDVTKNIKCQNRMLSYSLDIIFFHDIDKDHKILSKTRLNCNRQTYS